MSPKALICTCLFIGQTRVCSVFLNNKNFFSSTYSCCFLIRILMDFHLTGGIYYNQELKMHPFKVFFSLRKHCDFIFQIRNGWQSKVDLFSWNCRDLSYSRLQERHPIINHGLMKRMDLGHDPEPIVVNGRLFPLTSSGFGSGLYYLKWINS